MKTQIFTKLIVGVVITFCSLYSFSKNVYVNDAVSGTDVYCTASGSSSNNGLTPATPKALLSQALAVALSGDVIYVDAGSYIDSKIVLSKDNISIIGAGSSLTVFKQNSSSTLNYFMRIYNRSNITFKNLQIGQYSNNTSFEGESITIDGSTNVLFDNVEFGQNRTSSGEASIVINNNSTVTFESIAFSCQGVTSGQAGGGIDIKSDNSHYSKNVTLTINNSLITGNDRTSGSGNVVGGGMIISGDNSVVVNITNSRFYNNKAQSGGAIYIEGGILNVSNTLFDSNSAVGSADNNSYGGAIQFSGTSSTLKSTIKNCRFISNKSNNSFSFGGAISFNGGPTVAALGPSTNPNLVDIIDCEFTTNICSSGKGTDIYSKATKTNTVFISNSTLSGGTTSVYNTSGTINIVGCNNPNPSTFGTVVMDLVARSTTTSPSTPTIVGNCPTVFVCKPAQASATVAGCDGKATLTGTSPSGTIFYWYDNLADATTHATNSPKKWLDTSSTVTPNYDVTGISATKTYYVISNLDGCVTPTLITVTYNCPSCTPPTPIFTASPGATSCPNTNITYTTEAGNTAYVWSFPGTINVDYKIISGGTATDNTVTLQWLTSGSKTVTVGYTKAACASTTPASNTTTVSSPVTAIFTTSPGASSCSNTNITYTTQAGNSNYVWTFPGVLATDYTIISGGTTSDNTVTLQWLTSGNKTVTVGYTNSGCTSTTPASNTTNVTLKPSTPTIGTITQPTCTSSGSVVLNGLPAGTWTITPSTGSPVTNSGTSYTFTGLVASTTYTFTVQDSKGCTSDASVNVVMNAVPGKPTITGAASICVGSTVQLTGSGTTLSWVSSSNAVATVSNTGLVLGVSGGNVTITYTDITNCTQTASIQVDPTAVGGTATATSTNLCTNTSTTISLSGNSGTIQWQSSPDGSTNWTNIGGATSSTLTTPLLTTGTYYYRALITSGACVATATSNVVTVNVSPTPVAGTSKATPDTICAGNNSVLTLTGSTGSIQWQESLNGTSGWGNISGATGGTTANFTTANLNSTMYYKAILSSGACTNVESAVLKVVVNPNIAASVTIKSDQTETAGEITICPDYTVVFTATPSAGLGTVSYQWKNKGVNINLATKSTYTSAALKDGDIITCELTTLGGNCITGSPAISNAIKVNVLVKDLSLVGNSPSSCNATDGSIYVKGTGSGTVKWALTATPTVFLGSHNGVTLTKIAPFETIPNLEKGNYTVTFNNGTCDFTKDVILTDPSAPQDPLLSVSSTLPLCQGQSVTITANVVDPSIISGTTKYHWKLNNVDYVGAVQPQVGNSITVNVAGTYSVILEDGACTSNVNDTVIDIIATPATPTILSTKFTNCKSNNKQVSDITALITNATKTIIWYNQLVGGTAYNTTDVLTSSSYYAEQSEGTCKSNARLQVDVTIIDLAAPTIPGSTVPPSCTLNTGSVDVNMPSAGVWDVTATPTVGAPTTLTTTNLTNNPFTYSFAGLTANTNYTFTIKDINGCVSNVSNSVLIGPLKTPPLTPVLDGSAIYCASKSYTLDQITFSPAPTGTVKYYNAIDGSISGKTAVVSGTTYKFTFDNGTCESTVKLATTIPMDNGPILPPVVDVSATALICAIEKPTFNSLLSKSPIVIPPGYSIVISPSPTGVPILPNNTQIGSVGGITQTVYYNIVNDNGCQNKAFSKLQFKINEGPSDLVLQNGIVQFCADKNPTIADLASTKVSGTGTTLKWYASDVSNIVLSDTFPLTSGGSYYASLTATPGCESIIRKSVNVEVTTFGQTTLDADNNYTFCKGSDKKVSDLVTKPYTSANIVWLDASKIVQSPSALLISGPYYAAEKNGKCISDKPQEIEVKFTSPTISISPKKLPVCAIGNGSFVITGQDPTYTYSWSKDGVVLPETSSTLSGLPDDKNVKYSVIVTDAKGCVSKDTTSFTDCEPSLPPHIFTPDGNGKNDKFVLNYAGKYPKCKLLIYNRWGALVYESEIPYKDDWDGKPNVGATIGSNVLPASTYFYMIDKGDGTDPESGYVELVK